MWLLPSFMRMKKNQLPDAGADQFTLQLFQYFPMFGVVGAGTVNQNQFAVTAPAPPITLGVHVTVPKEAPVGGLGGLQDGSFVAAALYNPQTGVTGRGGI